MFSSSSIQMLDKFADDDRIDQLNAQKRRAKQMEHRRQIEKLLEDRREAFDNERMAEAREQMYIHIYIYIYIYILCMCVYIYIFIVYILCVCACVCVCVYIFMYIYRYIDI